MKVTNKPKMTLTQAKLLFKFIKSNGGTIKRGSLLGLAQIRDRRGQIEYLHFQNNLELNKLV